jgi:hypothetical protein
MSDQNTASTSLSSIASTGAKVGIDSDFSLTGVIVTQGEGGAEYGTIARAKDSSGKLKAYYFAKGVLTGQVTGYASTLAAPALGGTFKANGKDCTILSSQLQASNQDFVKVTASGKAIS